MLERGFQLVDELLDALLLNSELALLLLVDRLLFLQQDLHHLLSGPQMWLLGNLNVHQE